jgi:hypothetical protein
LLAVFQMMMMEAIETALENELAGAAPLPATG